MSATRPEGTYLTWLDCRALELENLRYAARLLNDEREDPRIEKKIVVEGNGLGHSLNIGDPN